MKNLSEGAHEITKMLWALIGLTVVISIAINLLTGWGVNNQNKQLTRLNNDKLKFTQQEANVRFLLDKSKDNILGLLNGEFIAQRRVAEESMRHLQQVVNALPKDKVLTDTQSGASSNASMWQSMQSIAAGFSPLLEDALNWKEQGKLIIEDVENNLSLKDVRAKLNGLQEGIERTVGRDRIRSAIQIQTYRTAKTEQSNLLAHQIVESYIKETMGNSRGLLQLHLAKVRRFVEVLAIEDDYNNLEDIQNYRLKPSLLTLQGVIKNMVVAGEVGNQVEFEALQAALVGSNQGGGKGFEGKSSRMNGLYNQRKNYLLMQLERTDLERRINQQIELFNEHLTAFVAQQWEYKLQLDRDSQNNLTTTWTLVALLSLLGFAIFMSLIRLVFKAIKDQVTALADLTRKSEASKDEAQNALGQLELAQQTLIQSEKMAALGTLVAGVAHEVNTPIGVCVTAVSTIEDRLLKFEKDYNKQSLRPESLESYIEVSKQALSLTSTNLKRASDLIKSFKEVAVDQHIDDKKIIELIPFIEESMLSLKHELKTGQHQLLIEGDRSVKAHVTPNRIWQVVSNLVLNAVRHAFDQKNNGTIRVLVEPLPNKRVLLVVEDNGSGMGDDTRRKCFDPFFTTARGTGGSGLGLSIVHTLISEGLGGTITVHSGADSEGTRFSLEFPQNLPQDLPTANI